MRTTPVNTAFSTALTQALRNAQKNRYGEDNMDPERLQKYVPRKLPLKAQLLDPVGFPIKFYGTPFGALKIFVLRQYKYDRAPFNVKVEKDDYVIDAGGCWGDTALFFALGAGNRGKVFTFEFIPSNLEILRKNVSLNPDLASRIGVVTSPLWRESNKTFFYRDWGPASSIREERSDRFHTQVETVSIDDFVRQRHVPSVDFIKMDIEGAELPALQGAAETLRRFRPKLALCVYHSLSDFVEIPRYLSSLSLGYKFYLDHYTIHNEETILFAKPI